MRVVAALSSGLSPSPFLPSFVRSKSPFSLPIADFFPASGIPRGCLCFCTHSPPSLSWLPPCWALYFSSNTPSTFYLRAFALALPSAWILHALPVASPSSLPGLYFKGYLLGTQHFKLHTQKFPPLLCFILPFGALLLSAHLTVTFTRWAVLLVSSIDVD